MLRDKEKFVAASALTEKKDNFEKIYLRGDYSDCFVSENFVVFWGRSDLKNDLIPPRLVYFGSYGAVGFFLNEVLPKFSDQQKVHQNSPEMYGVDYLSILNRTVSVTVVKNASLPSMFYLRVTGISREFELVTYVFVMGNVILQAKPEVNSIVVLPRTTSRIVYFEPRPLSSAKSVAIN